MVQLLILFGIILIVCIQLNIFNIRKLVHYIIPQDEYDISYSRKGGNRSRRMSMSSDYSASSDQDDHIQDNKVDSTMTLLSNINSFDNDHSEVEHNTEHNAEHNAEYNPNVEQDYIPLPETQAQWDENINIEESKRIQQEIMDDLNRSSEITQSDTKFKPDTTSKLKGVSI